MILSKNKTLNYFLNGLCEFLTSLSYPAGCEHLCEMRQSMLGHFWMNYSSLYAIIDLYVNNSAQQ
jgi:hypothetical protein